MPARRPPPPSTPSANNPDIVKCPIHGLAYNRARSSGCLRCVEPTRAAGRPVEGGPLARLWSWVNEGQDSIRRAFAGLAFALAIGFVPAAYYSFGISGADVRRIRARQAELSAQPGTPAVLDEFDRLDGAIVEVRRRGFEHTAVLWILVTAIAGGALHRFVGRASDVAARDG